MSTATVTDVAVPTDVDADSADKPAKVETLTAALRLFVRYPSPWLIFGTAAAAISMRFWLGGFGAWDLAVAVAIIAFWPIQEWLIHVFILHFKPFELFGKRMDLHLASEHRKHHRRPWIIPKIFVPIRAVIVGITLGVPLIIFALRQVGVPMELILSGIAVFFFFGSIYEWTHFLVHTSYKPKTRFYKRLWRNHRLHHFKNEKYWYGVTRLEGDLLLGTAPAPGSVEKSTTVRSIV